MSEWKTSPLSEVLDFREGPGIMARDFRDDGVPLIRLAGVKSGAHLLEGCNYLDPEDVARRWNQFRLREGDVLLSTSASLGEVAVVGPEGVDAVPYTGLIGFRPKDARIDSKFIRHMLTVGSFKEQIAAMGVGSVMQHFGPTHLRSMFVTYPPVEVQQGIADVLGALDDKIAANTQSVNLALELADAEFSKRVRGATPGQTFGEVATVGGGGTPRTSNEDYWNGDVSWATPTDVTALSAPYLTTTARTISKTGLANCSSALYPAGSILMTSRATIGAFALAQRPTAVNQGFIVVNAHDAALQMWLFHEMRARISEFISHANGATFLELSRGKFKAFTVRVAESQVMADFGVFAEALHEQAAALTAESDRLAATRDALLPLLMSGKVKVKDAESVVGGVI